MTDARCTGRSTESFQSRDVPRPTDGRCTLVVGGSKPVGAKYGEGADDYLEETRNRVPATGAELARVTTVCTD